ncbi:hypothetical protein [Streptomyces sp. SP18CS02]|uniref:hypothetical protein n=1 Tax=Streptomyces sp. SP18CS02 TaxID=3002531 RepID=UPI002E7969D8|nr:hypothetical protein [Streptomyces sp. SP18CS02]MEE1754675.1 hypothetical protein [Streptomyces sp. SP18CS02]
MIAFLRGAATAMLVAVNLFCGYVAFWALLPPQGAWDENGLTAIETGCFLLILLGGAVLLTVALPVRRRALSPWWLTPSAAFVVLGAARWTYVSERYPMPYDH